MKTPREKYQLDSDYRAFVDTLVEYITKCKYTPSEVREAAILACIIYEKNRIRTPLIKDTSRVHIMLNNLHEWLDEITYEYRGD
jgi:hypothetical protein